MTCRRSSWPGSGPRDRARARRRDEAARGADPSFRDGRARLRGAGSRGARLPQRGRIAWATTSDAPLVFRRELCERAKIELAAFRDVVEECRRTQRPLGETIVAWGLASSEDVRWCLASQIRRSLASLADRPDVDAVFLARGQRFHEYDLALTFELGEVAPCASEGANESAKVSTNESAKVSTNESAKVAS